MTYRYFNKKIMIVFVIFCFLFISSVYALAFDVNISISSNVVSVGDNVKIDFNIDSIGSSTGISSCEMNIVLPDGIELVNDYEMNTKWNYGENDDKLLFSSEESFLDNFKLFTLTVKVNKGGVIKFTNIKCSGNEESYSVNDKSLDISIKKENSSILSSSSSMSSLKPSSSSSSSSSLSSSPSSSSSIIRFIKGFYLRGGAIEFDDDVVRYQVYVNSLDDIEISPILLSDVTYEQTDNYVDDDGREFVFTFKDSNGNSREYRILFLLSGNYSDSLVEKLEIDDAIKEKPNYSQYFIAIIIILIAINVYRVISNKKKVMN